MTKKGKKAVNKKSKFDFSKILIGNMAVKIIFLLLGIYIYLNPTVTIEIAGVLLGIYFIIIGIFNIFEFIIRDKNPLFNFNILWGILITITGIFTISNPFQIIKILTFTLGIYLIIISLGKIINSLKLKKCEYDGWLITLVIALILLLFGIFIVINPMASKDLVEITGIFIILANILEISNLLMIYKKSEDIIKIIKK